MAPTATKTEAITFPFPREQNPWLYDLYAERLREPGWAGEMTPSELEWLKDQLHRSAQLRRRWGLRRRFSEEKVRRLAREGMDPPENGLKRRSPPSKRS